MPPGPPGTAGVPPASSPAFRIYSLSSIDPAGNPPAAGYTTQQHPDWLQRDRRRTMTRRRVGATLVSLLWTAIAAITAMPLLAQDVAQETAAAAAAAAPVFAP